MPDTTEPIKVNIGGWHAAMEALMMDDPHPKGYITDSTMARLSRALYAYEWAKAEYPIETRSDGSHAQQLPPVGAAWLAVLDKEARDE